MSAARPALLHVLWLIPLCAAAGAAGADKVLTVPTAQTNPAATLLTDEPVRVLTQRPMRPGEILIIPTGRHRDRAGPASAAANDATAPQPAEAQAGQVSFGPTVYYPAGYYPYLYYCPGFVEGADSGAAVYYPVGLTACDTALGCAAAGADYSGECQRSRYFRNYFSSGPYFDGCAGSNSFRTPFNSPSSRSASGFGSRYRSAGSFTPAAQTHGGISAPTSHGVQPSRSATHGSPSGSAGRSAATHSTRTR